MKVISILHGYSESFRNTSKHIGPNPKSMFLKQNMFSYYISRCSLDNLGPEVFVRFGPRLGSFFPGPGLWPRTGGLKEQHSMCFACSVLSWCLRYILFFTQFLQFRCHSDWTGQCVRIQCSIFPKQCFHWGFLTVLLSDRAHGPAYGAQTLPASIFPSLF